VIAAQQEEYLLVDEVQMQQEVLLRKDGLEVILVAIFFGLDVVVVCKEAHVPQTFREEVT
jgi:hypothetical protein